MNGFIGCKDEISALQSRFIEPYLDTYKTASSSYLPRSLCPPPAPALVHSVSLGSRKCAVFWQYFLLYEIFHGGWAAGCHEAAPHSSALNSPHYTKKRIAKRAALGATLPPDPESQSIRVQIMSWVTPTPAREHGVGKDVMLHCYIHRINWNTYKIKHINTHFCDSAEVNH